MKVMTRQQVREFDRHAIEDLGVPGVVLMENAGRQAADEAALLLVEHGGRGALVVAGGGNNGGDGFVVARHLAVRGYGVEVLLLVSPQKLTGDAAINFALLQPLGIAVTELSGTPQEIRSRILDHAAAYDLIIDALLGTGLLGEVREPFLSAINAINETGRPVLSIDIPSGLDADTGRPLGAAVRATTTITFVARKAGFLQDEARSYLGRVEVADIGVPLRKL
jgi:NAD(P)H-hydrate epimerase